MRYRYNKKLDNTPAKIVGATILIALSILLGAFLCLKYIESHLPQVQARGAFLELQEKPEIKLHADLSEPNDIQPAAGYEALSWRLR